MAEEQKEEAKIGTLYPIDEVFKYREKNRIAPAWSNLGRNISYIAEGIEYIEGQGIFTKWHGVPHMSKGLVYPEAAYAMGVIKKLFIHILRVIANKDMILSMLAFFIQTKKTQTRVLQRALDAINTIVFQTIQPHYLKDGYYSAACVQVRNFVREFFVSLGVSREAADLFGENVAFIFQNDNAYYFRFVDLMKNTNKERMLKNFPKECLNLLQILEERNNPHGARNEFEHIGKFKNLYTMLKVAYYIPRFRKALKHALNAVVFPLWQADEADEYHMYLQGDYNYMGLNNNDRVEAYKKYHTDRGLDLPTRIEYTFNS